MVENDGESTEQNGIMQFDAQFLTCTLIVRLEIDDHLCFASSLCILRFALTIQLI